MRVNIATDVARGLLFLHRLETQVIFHEIKSSRGCVPAEGHNLQKDFGKGGSFVAGNLSSTSASASLEGTTSVSFDKKKEELFEMLGCLFVHLDYPQCFYAETYAVDLNILEENEDMKVAALGEEVSLEALLLSKTEAALRQREKMKSDEVSDADYIYIYIGDSDEDPTSVLLFASHHSYRPEFRYFLIIVQTIYLILTFIFNIYAGF
ncbi:uncharacterized protein LOC109704439 [Ananas comosus]|uniref:Uncharacterized protein LOC109704439 n=1 Tax=Ananas comosus TaxID=4615 RepID=A0A6P5EBP1_ANACO|nr:uncharacterized protein LOC109704439 [Ananas comosus]